MIAATTALALGALSAGCAWLVGVNGDVQLEPTGDATTDHDAIADDARDAPMFDDSGGDAASDTTSSDEDGAAWRDGNEPDRDGAADGDAKG